MRQEYADRMDELYAGWEAKGLVKPSFDGMDFWQKLDQCNKGGFDWYQPFDISLPHDDITEETQMHFGPAIFDIVTHKNILDTVEKLIGPEITSNPIQHVRIKPPEQAVPKDEIRAHIVSTDWHQDQGGHPRGGGQYGICHRLAGNYRCDPRKWMSSGFEWRL